CPSLCNIKKNYYEKPNERNNAEKTYSEEPSEINNTQKTYFEKSTDHSVLTGMLSIENIENLLTLINSGKSLEKLASLDFESFDVFFLVVSYVLL
ncbi:1460_t:CDS:2, partial [Cetraspora pellucida]